MLSMGQGIGKSLPLPISSIFTVSKEIPSERGIQPQSSSHIQEQKQSCSFCSITQDTLPPEGLPTLQGSAAVNPNLTVAIGSLCFFPKHINICFLRRLSDGGSVRRNPATGPVGCQRRNAHGSGAPSPTPISWNLRLGVLVCVVQLGFPSLRGSLTGWS